MKKKVIASMLAAVLCLTAFSGCGSTASSSNAASSGIASTSSGQGSGPVYKIRVGHVLANTHPYQIGLKKFADLAKEKSGGKIEVDVFPNSELGNERDMLEALQLGTQEMVLVSTAVLSGFTDQFLVFDLPFMFDTTQEARKVCDSDLGMKILHSVDDNGLKGLAWFENGFRDVTNNVRPIVHPDDLKGIKIRTMESPIHIASFNAMGAQATPMAMGDLFTALQQGTLDAQENPLAIIDTNKFYEIQKYLSMTEHFYAPAPLFIATDYYNNMDADSQKAIEDAAKEAAIYERQTLDDMNVTLKDSLADDGMKINEVDKSEFKKSCQSVYDKYVAEGAGNVSPDIYKQVCEILGR
jgi:tripartite ATP-independent transporter DctP family solute receptor